MLVVRSRPGRGARRIVALAATVVAMGAACAAPTVQTSGGPQGSTPPRGTVLVDDASGDAAANALGAAVQVTPETTTTTVPETTTTTVVIVTTLPPKITTTTPPVTLTVPTPTATVPIPTGKPLPTEISPASFSADERVVFDKINSIRAGKGLAPYIPEQGALAGARAHSTSMASSGRLSSISNIFDAVSTQYRTAGQGELNGSDANYFAQSIAANFPQLLGEVTFAYVGVGIASGNGQKWLTIIAGA